MSIFYRKYQNRVKESKMYGKWYARVVTMGKTVTLEELAEHMAQHNTPYSEGVIRGVLTDMVNCIRELVLEGKSVKIPNLAIFSAKRFSAQTAHAASKSARDETANVPPNSFSSAAE